MTCTRIILLTFVTICLMPSSAALAWWECGHHLIAELAFDLLEPSERQQLLAILKNHPRWREDFQVPDEITSTADKQYWLVGRAAYWPDVARSQPEFNRPSWHYQLTATLVMGDEVQLPQPQTELPSDADLGSSDLYVLQAIQLCRQVLSDRDRPSGERALAIAWLGHLVGDSHQPCHAGSLYVQGLFPAGDRGANSIRLRQKNRRDDPQNLHAMWDSLLGSDFSMDQQRAVRNALRSNTALMREGRQALLKPNGRRPEQWLQESREMARSHVYTPEILVPIRAAMAGGAERLDRISLPGSYTQEARRAAQLRAVQAAHRLAYLWQSALSNGGN